MQVFTTIFLAETLSSDTGTAEKSCGEYQEQRELSEIKRTNLERIAMLESRNWFLDDLSSED
jgi:hypothetical protein